MRKKNKLKRAALALLFPSTCFAIHPLASEDTDTQGSSHFQLELSVDKDRRERGGEVRSATEANATLTYGLTDSVDVALNTPYRRLSATDSATERGVGDASLLLKWRFWESDGFSLGIRPQIGFATGDAQRGLGGGKTSYGATLLAALERESYVFLANAGYRYNNNSVGDRTDLWNASAAVLWKLAQRWRLALDVGGYRNPDPAMRQNPAFAIFGLIYSPTKDLDLDVGVRKGLNDAEVDRTLGVGLTIRW